MDELEAAAAVLAMSRDDFAEEDVEQRAPCVEHSGSAAGTMAVEAGKRFEPTAAHSTRGGLANGVLTSFSDSDHTARAAQCDGSLCS